MSNFVFYVENKNTTHKLNHILLPEANDHLADQRPWHVQIDHLETLCAVGIFTAFPIPGVLSTLELIGEPYKKILRIVTLYLLYKYYIWGALIKSRHVHKSQQIFFRLNFKNHDFRQIF